MRLKVDISIFIRRRLRDGFIDLTGGGGGGVKSASQLKHGVYGAYVRRGAVWARSWDFAHTWSQPEPLGGHS